MKVLDIVSLKLMSKATADIFSFQKKKKTISIISIPHSVKTVEAQNRVTQTG